jgi:hypothetical protein
MLRIALCSFRSPPLFRRTQFHTRSPRFRKAYGNRLFRGSRAMLTLANMMHLLPKEFPSLR